MEKWVAPHDVKDYGDTDESVYRDFFKKGYVRIELAVPDMKTGEHGKKVFYAPNPRQYLSTKVDEYITISEKMYQKIEGKLNIK